MNSLPALESKIATDGLTHQYMLDFFRLISTSASNALLPTFETWVESLRQAGIEVDEDWYNRIVNDLTIHGRLTAETIIQAPEVPITVIGEDPDVEQ